MELEDIISKYPPKQIMLVPIAVIILALISLGVTYLSTGSPVKLGIEFTGGTLITVPGMGSEESVAEEFAGYPLVDIRDIGNRYMIQFGPMSDSQYSALAKLANDRFDSPDIRHMGPIYSKELQSQVARYLPLSFIFMAIVVFVVFRQIVVSTLVVLCALADILIAAASMNLTGVELSLGTVAALLMLIGYSVDTDILLSMRVLKRKGDVDEKIKGAMRNRPDHGRDHHSSGDSPHNNLQLPLSDSSLFHQNGHHRRHDHGSHIRPGCGCIQHLGHQCPGAEMVPGSA